MITFDNQLSTGSQAFGAYPPDVAYSPDQVATRGTTFIFGLVAFALVASLFLSRKI